MPETIVIPNLSSPPAASTARPVAAGHGGIENSADASSASAAADSAVVQGKDVSPFAAVLQRQMAQAKAGETPVAIPAAKATTPEDMPPDGLAALLLSMGTMVNSGAGLMPTEKKPLVAPEDTQQLTAAQATQPVTDPSALLATSALLPTSALPVTSELSATSELLATPALPLTTALPITDTAAALPAVPVSVAAPVAGLAATMEKVPKDLAAKTSNNDAAALVTVPAEMMAVATQLAAATQVTAAPQMASAASASVATTTKADVAVAQEPTAEGLAALLSQSMGAKPDTVPKTSEKKPSAATPLQLASAPAAPIQAQSGGDMAAKRVAETAISAAVPSPIGDAKDGHANNVDAAAPKLTFENQLVTAQNVMQTQASVAPATVPLKLETPVGTRGWDGEFGDKVVWMVGHQQQRAELVLNPPALGRVEVTLSMTGDQANASFTSANPAVRDALEAALPRLREILADAGINLGQAHVGSESSNQYANKQENWDNPARRSGNFAQGGSDLRQISVEAPWLKQSNSLVDVFA